MTQCVYVLGGIEDGTPYPVGAYGWIESIKMSDEDGVVWYGVRVGYDGHVWTTAEWIRAAAEDVPAK